MARLRFAQNHALVRDLADDEGLLAWLEEACLSATEAARIQPTYGPMLSPRECACRALDGILVVGTVVERKKGQPSCLQDLDASNTVSFKSCNMMGPNEQSQGQGLHARAASLGRIRRVAFLPNSARQAIRAALPLALIPVPPEVPHP